MFETMGVLREDLKCESGLLASGSKLSDRKKFVVGDLLSREPEIIGGEMEASGVASACERKKTPWIIVKAICDWGYDKQTPEKVENQKAASNNAMSLIIDVLQLINQGT
jgi:nucleoside phosphorylase